MRAVLARELQVILRVRGPFGRLARRRVVEVPDGELCPHAGTITAIEGEQGRWRYIVRDLRVGLENGGRERRCAEPFAFER